MISSYEYRWIRRLANLDEDKRKKVEKEAKRVDGKYYDAMDIKEVTQGVSPPFVRLQRKPLDTLASSAPTKRMKEQRGIYATHSAIARTSFRSTQIYRTESLGDGRPLGRSASASTFQNSRSSMMRMRTTPALEGRGSRIQL